MNAIAAPGNRTLKRLRRRVQRGVPLIVWVLALGGALALSLGQPAGFVARGVAEPARRSAAADSAGLVRVVAVRVHQRVKAGDVLASLDDGAVLARVKRARAQLERISSERDLQLARETEKAQRQKLEGEDENQWRHRRLRRDVESFRLALLRTEAELEEDRLVLAGLELDVARIKNLIAQGVATQAKGDQLEARAAALREKIARTAVVTRELRTELRESRARRAGAVDLDAPAPVAPELAAAPWRWALDAQQAELDLLAIERARLVVRAPVSGRIERVNAYVGQTVARGAALFTVVEDAPGALVVYTPAPSRGALRVGLRVQVRSASGRQAETTVASIGPAFATKPSRLWLTPDQPEWGLPITLAPTGSAFVVPGETFAVRFSQAPSAGDEAPAELGAAVRRSARNGSR